MSTENVVVTEEMAVQSLEKMEAEGVPAYQALKSLIRISFQRLDFLQKVMTKIAREHVQIQQFIMGEGASAAPHGASAPAPANGASRVRIGADGTPMSPEQAAIEDQMDAAAGPREGTVPPGGPVRGGVKTPPQDAPITQTRLGADGNPLTPEQEAAERAMDAALA